MDDADRVTEKAEFEMNVALYRSRKNTPEIQPIGRCLYCDEPFIAEDDRDISKRRWCDAECRDAWEEEQW